jgi:single-strand DNA-binding protein
MSMHVNFVGRLGADPETRQVGQDAACSFRMAISEKRRDGEVTTWVKVTAWGKMGEACQRFLTKGREAFVVGTLTTSTYQGRDGQQATSLDVRASSVQFVGGQRGGDSEADQGERTSGGQRGGGGGGWGGAPAGGGGGWGNTGGASAGFDDDDPIPF